MNLPDVIMPVGIVAPLRENNPCPIFCVRQSFGKPTPSGGAEKTG
ncbi:hypothetical protein ASZ90_006879 [hydrocarbon metagenome]|uniref:Uncharacterized protein n=1 Tax=hydrocarbon metagenome TaxID=938273 RepID=A0A0W8FQU0_9ZZZZ